MTNEELRIAIAKVKYTRVEIRGCMIDPEGGWLDEIQDMDRRYSENHTTSERYILCPCRFEKSFTDDELGYVEIWEPVPDWTNDIAAAMTLMQEAADKNIYCSLVYSRHYRMWTARFETNLTQRHNKFPARAIAESYLVWKEARE